MPVTLAAIIVLLCVIALGIAVYHARRCRRTLVAPTMDTKSLLGVDSVAPPDMDLTASIGASAGTAAVALAQTASVNIARHAGSNAQVQGEAVCFTHEGGAGDADKENQDAYFELSVSKDVHVFAVFDGHGKANGRLAATAASSAMRARLSKDASQLEANPEGVVRAAFAAAHEAVRTAILALPDTLAVGAHVLEKRIDEEDGKLRWDAADGGTTATVAVLLRNRGTSSHLPSHPSTTSLLIAAVGDSTAALLGRRRADGHATCMPLLSEHGPSNLAEYERMSSTPEAAGLRFVYDCPDDVMIDVFTAATPADSVDVVTSVAPAPAASSAPAAAVVPASVLLEQPAAPPALARPKSSRDVAAERRADREHQCRVKNARGELMTCVVVPEASVTLPAHVATAHAIADGVVHIEEHHMTMTRSLGDFHAHTVGVLAEPEVRLIPQLEAMLSEQQWEHSALFLASDGVWDLWRGDEVADKLLPTSGSPSPATPSANVAAAAAFCEATRAQGEEYFGEGADNLTGVLVALGCEQRVGTAEE